MGGYSLLTHPEFGQPRSMSVSDEDARRDRALNAAADMAVVCEELRGSTIHGLNPLDIVMNDLMTELWDRGFSQSEIRTAFGGALGDMDRYAAGEERR